MYRLARLAPASIDALDWRGAGSSVQRSVFRRDVDTFLLKPPELRTLNP